MANKKLKTKRGITLIALVITIIVMLILVAATVTVALNGGLFKSAKKATVDTELAREEESQLSSGRVLIDNVWYDSIENYIAGIESDDQGDAVTGAEAWTEEKDESGNITIKRGSQTLNIGDYVDYTTEESPETLWRVLGVEKGRLLLMADSNVLDENNSELKVELSGSNWGEDGEPLVKKLNEACKPYLNEEYAESIRSIKVEDINNITGYNPLCEGIKNPTDEQIKSGSKYGKDQPYEYGNKVKYTWSENGYVMYDDSEGINKHIKKKSTYSTFTMPPKGDNLSTDGLTLESANYMYYPYTLANDSSASGSVKGISTTSAAYKMIFENSNGAKEGYLLASPSVGTNDYVVWSLRAVNPLGYVNGYVLWSSKEGVVTSLLGIRPVVSLKSDINLTKDEEVEEQNGSVTYKLGN